MAIATGEAIVGEGTVEGVKGTLVISPVFHAIGLPEMYRKKVIQF